jgi:hypothetical protein
MSLVKCKVYEFARIDESRGDTIGPFSVRKELAHVKIIIVSIVKEGRMYEITASHY